MSWYNIRLCYCSSFSKIIDVDFIVCIPEICRHNFVDCLIHLDFLRCLFSRRNTLFRMLLGLLFDVVDPYVVHGYGRAQKLVRMAVEQRQQLLRSWQIWRLWLIVCKYGAYLADSCLIPIILITEPYDMPMASSISSTFNFPSNNIISWISLNVRVWQHQLDLQNLSESLVHVRP